MGLSEGVYSGELGDVLPYISDDLSCRLKHDYHSPNARHSSSTIDPENMKVMTDVKESWWNPDGPIKPLHAMNKIR